MLQTCKLRTCQWACMGSLWRSVWEYITNYSCTDIMDPMLFFVPARTALKTLEVQACKFTDLLAHMQLAGWVPRCLLTMWPRSLSIRACLACSLACGPPPLQANCMMQPQSQCATARNVPPPTDPGPCLLAPCCMLQSARRSTGCQSRVQVCCHAPLHQALSVRSRSGFLLTGITGNLVWFGFN